ncbi:MAG: asparagine synthase (glutamine-hydrolyzing) [Deltaproteobacteria bacterium GWA2_38_16]|nr:MAG: asparagine synthase (glutamine-hydrolyzing) [Deltaproteobacteria bacterium GWA2_38_16]OGQ01844.1 MAG: asparagine synthase (glutamine-hydrolyzing) [Deltaproteobacteria bacterium RIFCSPHIGHO2_02_FULL_38_15]OGQ34103.1 MAG: asparagine synthase (glutamine-hydrolyzing) [Deltaproteobacteria bacterium RIFCSPLOWO2_01_FULL_38_9]OGQ60768.1 MAG: asparagine synthase (glutamine-hydrolyzing) [Deltaproteobacteria bacterium RIFCSPLOWO2_12_FULL_38_8]HBQ20801.1 asparagine synthase (glutamine-hydrolyzing) 
MCGINGYSGFRDPRLIQQMVETLSHRGPDEQGIYQDEDISLGHARLSIIDLSPQGHQPMTNEDGSLYLVFNGEIYNFVSLRETLSQKGHIFKSKTDTEVILHGYEEYGEEFISSLEGMFAFALWDKKQKKLVLARDSIGIKPLYYYWDGQKLIFSSEIKSILCSRDVQQKISLQESLVPFYLTFQYSPPQKTLFKNIFKLEPGYLLIFKNGQCQLKSYVCSQNVLVDEEKIKELLKESVQTKLISDVPLGVLLSGGLDSSSIVALMSNVSESITTFTAGFHQKNDEFYYADLVANQYKTKQHHFFIESKNIIQEIEKIIWHMDEPLADTGAIATYFISRYLKEHVKVILVGEGGDEVFGGYSWYQLSKFKFIPQKYLLKMYFYLTTFIPSSIPWYSEVYKQFLDLFEPYLHEKTLFQGFTRFELEKVLPNHLLMKVDKMTMAHGIEARVPFLDQTLVRSISALPDEYRIKGWQGKWLLRKLMKNKLSPQILKRKKQGFSLPLKKWLSEDLKPLLEDTFFSSRAKVLDVIDKDTLKQLMIKSYGLKEIERVSLLWRLFLFEIWYQRFFIKKSSA